MGDNITASTGLSTVWEKNGSDYSLNLEWETNPYEVDIREIMLCISEQIEELL